MISSMTAFARRESRGDFGLLVCEIRSVNHRYLEPNLRLADALRELEMPVRERLRQGLSRGKVDVTLRHEPADALLSHIHINSELASRLVAAAAEIDKLTRHAAPLNAADILRIPGVVCPAEPDQQQLAAAALALFGDTLGDFVAMRRREGEVLAGLIAGRLEAVTVECDKVAARMPDILDHFRQRLLARLSEVRGDLNAERLEQEMVLFAHKIDVAEELDRLRAHVVEVRRVLTQGGAVGRKLDFLCQEFNREANTLCSKSADMDLTRIGLDLKTAIEQLREQAANVE